MSEARTRQPYPTWAEEIRSLAGTAAVFTIAGNVEDLFLGPDQAPVEIVDLLFGLLGDMGFDEVIAVRPGPSAQLPEGQSVWNAVSADRRACAHVDEAQMLQLMIGLTATNRARAVIVKDASRMVVRPGELSDGETAAFRDLRRITDELMPGRNGQFNLLLWLTEAPHDVPPWFSGSNPRGRTVSVPLPRAADREALAGRILERTTAHASASDRRATQRMVVDQTDGLQLRSITQILSLARRRGDVVAEADEAIRLFRFGVTDNPWREPRLAARLRSELQKPDHGLPSRVIGQQPAIEKALDVLVRSATGLRSAHAPSGTAKPRGVLFFAGPTGVGKTELAKALAALLFGDDAAMTRFDMSEFASEHTAERLVGAPPGYVGFSQGGELTNAVRARPFSLLLFDEIEKAHTSLLDRFLQVLDDGRLTDGRGETTYFTETVIVFTSNLGIYEPVRDPGSGITVGRQLAVDPTATYEDLAEEITERVREHFTSIVGRPELLNRLGDNIVVFDFIRGPAAAAILKGMVRSVARVFQNEHAATLRVSDPAMKDLRSLCLTESALMMGGRGIGNMLETVLIDPLARWTFTQQILPSSVLIDGIRPSGSRFELDIGSGHER